MMTVPAETADIDRAIASFRAGVAAAAGEGLTPRDWSAEDWRELFRFTGLRRISAADALIRRGDPDRTLYFVLRGDLEVVIHLGDGISIGPSPESGQGRCSASNPSLTAIRDRRASGRLTNARWRR
jgi:CRP-like cAMP-binding protein